MCNEKEHVFEHLGKPPYKFAGYGELAFIVPGTGINKAGGSCDHCGSAIRHAFYLESADGKRFKVGSLCVTKSGDKGLRKVIDAEVKKHKREKEKLELVEFRKELATLTVELKDKLVALKHPNIYMRAEAGGNKTYHDYMVHMVANSNCWGYAATKRIVKYLRSLKTS